MSAITAELEAELQHELSHEAPLPTAAHLEAAGAHHEAPLSHEHEAEADKEQEAFFNQLAAMADRSGRSQALRKIALAAARQALRTEIVEPPIVEGEFEAGAELRIAPELELTGLDRAQSVALMEHLAHAAASAESEQEAAEHFLPLIPLAAKFVAPLAAKALPILAKKALPKLLGRIGPQLTRGISNVARTLFRSPVARPLVRTLPTIARNTVATVARQHAKGATVTPQTALRTLAVQTARTLGHAQTASQAYRRARYWDGRYHRTARRIVGYSVPPRVTGAPPLRTGPVVTPVNGAPIGMPATPVVAPTAPGPTTTSTPYASLPVPVVALVPFPYGLPAANGPAVASAR